MKDLTNSVCIVVAVVVSEKLAEGNSVTEPTVKDQTDSVSIVVAVVVLEKLAEGNSVTESTVKDLTNSVCFVAAVVGSEKAGRQDVTELAVKDLIQGHLTYVQSDHLKKEPAWDAFLFIVTDGVNTSLVHRFNFTIIVSSWDLLFVMLSYLSLPLPTKQCSGQFMSQMCLSVPLSLHAF